MVLLQGMRNGEIAQRRKQVLEDLSFGLGIQLINALEILNCGGGVVICDTKAGYGVGKAA